ncbi:MAG: hypothetical protein LBP77_00995 [Rickettsiales bacterium]|jgi:hypothetical protein|nr:hypothetical protein [Rickettsiales bacterium]
MINNFAPQNNIGCIYRAEVKYIEEKYQILSDNDDVVNEISETLLPFIMIKRTNEILKNNLMSIFLISKEINSGNIMAEIENEGENIIIDTSLYKDLSSNGKKIRYEDGYLIYISKTKSIFDFNFKAKRISLYNSEKNLLVRDAVRIIKSIISIDCEIKGQIILHASGVVLNQDEAILFLGDSRNGKTSILLETLTKFDADMLSCDTSVLRIEKNQLIAQGWPSNFSISFGTMHDYADLYQFIPQDKRKITYNDAWHIYDKHVLNTNQVISALKTNILPIGKVSTLICLNFTLTSKVQLIEIVDYDDVENWIKKIYLGSRDPLYPNWHKFHEISDAQISANIQNVSRFIVNNGIKVYQMDWAPGPEQLLKQLDNMILYNKNVQHLA